MTLPQRLLDRYELQQCLGQSVFARTYAAQDLQDKQPVIVKALNLSHLDAWKNLELFQREAKVLAHLEHPAIPRLLDSFEQGEGADRAFYLVQEKVTGENLKQKFDKGWRPDQAQAAEIARQVLNILVYLQSFSPPIVHRDIKPSNLMLDAKGKVWLIDFGAVQELLKPRGGSTVVGTYGYMAPEQFSGQAVPASDLYSLGATLVFLMTGTAPSELPQNRMKIAFEAHLQASDAFKAWLGQLLEPTVAKRCPSAADALSALENLQTQPVVPQQSAPRPWLPLQPESGLPVKYSAEGMQVSLPKHTKGILRSVKPFFLLVNLVCSLPAVIFATMFAWGGSPETVFINFMSASTLILCFNMFPGLFLLLLIWTLIQKQTDLTITPYLITQGNFVLPTHLAKKLVWNDKSTYAMNDSQIIFLKSASYQALSQYSADLTLSQQAIVHASLNEQQMHLLLKPGQYPELIKLIQDWMQKHAKEIEAASQVRLDQALPQLTPALKRRLNVSQENGVVTVKLLNPSASLQFLPDVLLFSQHSKTVRIPWHEISDIVLDAKVEDSGEDTMLYYLLSLHTSAGKHRIWRLKASEQNQSAMVWLKDMLDRYARKNQAHREGKPK